MADAKNIQDSITIAAEPYAFTFPRKHTALLIIDMQRDFICSKGFGEIQGGNLEAVQAAIEPTRVLLKVCRGAGLHVFHTREGHVPTLADCPSSKLIRQAAAPGNAQHLKVIGDEGSMGRLLVRGEYGHDIVDELQPLPSEVVIDKSGKGSFWNTSLMRKLKSRWITHLLVAGVTTECCFSTTIREANDRGFECCGIVESTAGYNASFKTASLAMISWSQGLFGFVAELQPLVNALSIPSCSPTAPAKWDGKLDITSLRRSYTAGLSPSVVVEALYDRIEKYRAVDPAIWIRLEPKDKVLAAAEELSKVEKSRLPPLFGVPFSVKDSIDIAGIETTTACPPVAFTPATSSPCYERVIAAGGLYLGKVNLDQFATGLSGCRSPYGIPHSVYSQEHVSGGSSSGSCVSVGADLVTFSLATDTAGSGRVPSGFNGVVGFKPTRGLIPFEGITPACLSLDCVAVIAKTVSDAQTVWGLCEEFDARDRYGRDSFPPERHVDSLGAQVNTFTFGIPPAHALAICSPDYQQQFTQKVNVLQKMGGQLATLDWAPFENASKLLYEGTFVSERLAGLPDDFLEKNKDHLHPVILELFQKVVARQSTAVQAYRDMQARALFTRQATIQFTSHDQRGLDVVVVPTAPAHPTIKEMLAEPLLKNSFLGEFTHFGNILDLCAVATPAGTFKCSVTGATLPFSVTFLGARCTDSRVLNIAERFQAVATGMTLESNGGSSSSDGSHVASNGSATRSE